MKNVEIYFEKLITMLNYRLLKLSNESNLLCFTLYLTNL